MKIFLLSSLFCLYVFKVVGQNNMLIQTGEGSNRLSLLSNGSIVSIVPSSSAELITVPTTENSNVAGGDTRNLDWELKFSQPNKVFKDVSFADSQTGYIVTEAGAVYKTSDGGDSWNTVLDLSFPYYWYGVEALTPDSVIIAGFINPGPINEGVVRWTYDGGATWQQDIILPMPGTGVGWLERVHFFNQDTGIVFASFSGGCWRTTTGGKDLSSWSYTQINSDLAWFAGNIDAQSSGRVYATGIYLDASEDYGVNWTVSPSADSVFDGGVDFLDENNLYGWTGGGLISAPVSGWVRRTLDGGQSWSFRLNTFPYPIRAIRFISETEGWAIGGNIFEPSGGIYSTEDGGLTWNLDVNTGAEMFSIEIKNSSPDTTHLWCVGSSISGSGILGVLYKATMGNISTGVYNNDITGGQKHVLNQNYPNPFSTLTKISYELPKTSHVLLKVYNTLGREITTLVNEEQLAGFKEVNFDAAGLPDGMYVIKLQAGSFAETKRCILMKL